MKLNNSKRFIKTSITYFFGNILSKLIVLFLIPIYTYTFSPDEFGEYGLITSLLALFTPIIFFQIWDGVFRFTFDYEFDSDKRIVISNGLIMFFISLVVFSIIYFNLSNLHNFYFFMVFIYSICIGLQYLYGVVARSFLDNKTFVFSGLFNTLVNFTSVLIMIFKFDIGIESLFVSSSLGIIAQIIIIEIKYGLISKFRINHFNIIIFRKLVLFSFPISLYTLSLWLLNGFTQFFISKYLGSYYNGLFSIANRFSSILLLLIGVVQFSWSEFAFLSTNNKEKKYNYDNFFNQFIRLLFYFSGFIILIIKVAFPYMVNNSFLESLNIIPIVIIGTSLSSLSGLLGTILLSIKKSSYLFPTTAISGIFNVALCYILLNSFGFIGIILSLALSLLVGFLLRILILKKVLLIRINQKLIIALILLILTTLAYYIVNDIIGLILVIVMNLSFLVYFELEFFKSIFSNISNFKKYDFKKRVP